MVSPGCVQYNGIDLKKPRKSPSGKGKNSGTRQRQEHVQRYESVTQEVVLGELQVFAESECVCGRVAVGGREATDNTRKLSREQIMKGIE